MKNFNNYINKDASLSSIVFNKEIFKHRLWLYFPYSNIFIFIYFQIVLNSLFPLVPIIFPNSYEEVSIKTFIQIYNIICLIFEIFYHFIIRKNLRKKITAEENSENNKKFTYKGKLIFEIFFNVKIFFDFIIFFFMKNTKVNSANLKDNEEASFEYFVKILIFLLMFNISFFYFSKINFSTKFSFKIFILMLILMFMGFTVFFIFIYFIKNQLIFVNRFHELIFCECCLIIYLLYICFIAQINNKVYKLVKFIKGKLLNLKALVDFLQSNTEENLNEGFLSFQIPI